MTKQLTDKQEAFCQAIAAGKNMSDAYRTAYDCKNMTKVSVNVKASQMMARDSIGLRVKELRAPAVAAAALTAETHMAELKRLRDLALDAGKHSEAIRAEELRGKVAGLYVVRVEAGDPGAFQALDAQSKMSALEAIKLELDRRATLQLEVTDVTPKEPL
jgi:hypothetical protein